MTDKSATRVGNNKPSNEVAKGARIRSVRWNYYFPEPHDWPHIHWALFMESGAMFSWECRDHTSDFVASSCAAVDFVLISLATSTTCSRCLCRLLRKQTVNRGLKRRKAYRPKKGTPTNGVLCFVANTRHSRPQTFRRKIGTWEIRHG